MCETLICCYGDYFELSSRSLNAISNTGNPLHVGLNACGSQTKNLCRKLLDENKIQTLIDSNININKDPMMRKLIDCVESEYFIWFDDDSYPTQENWGSMLTEYIKKYHPFDVAGFPHVSNRLAFGKYQQFLTSRPWYKGRTYQNINQCIFPIGSIWVARKAFLKKYNYPDDQTIKNIDDMLLGDLIHQSNARFLTLFGWDTIFKANQSERRGVHDNDDGFKTK